jgi:hypothetical protein
VVISLRVLLAGRSGLGWLVLLNMVVLSVPSLIWPFLAYRKMKRGDLTKTASIFSVLLMDGFIVGGLLGLNAWFIKIHQIGPEGMGLAAVWYLGLALTAISTIGFCIAVPLSKTKPE